MSFCSQHDADFTTDANGDATVYTGVVIGRVMDVRYDYGDAATGGDFTITGEISGKAIFTLTNGGVADLSWRPRDEIHTAAETGAGTAVTFDGTRKIYEPIWICNERIKIVVSNGGATKVGQFEFIIG